jgi:hypothetical protein
VQRLLVFQLFVDSIKLRLKLLNSSILLIQLLLETEDLGAKLSFTRVSRWKYSGRTRRTHLFEIIGQCLYFFGVCLHLSFLLGQLSQKCLSLLSQFLYFCFFVLERLQPP